MSTIENRLKALRNKNGLTQDELVSELNSRLNPDEKAISKMTVSNWENNKHAIKPDKAQALADYFGVSVGYLLGYVDYNDRDISAPDFWKEYGDGDNMDLGYGIAVATVGKDLLDKVVGTIRELCDYNQDDFFENGEGKGYDEEGKKEYLDYYQMVVDEKIADLIRVLVTIPDGNHLRDFLFSYLTLEKQSRELLNK
ncbi:TPA: helix-turn-helix domain-containing protein, partial [Streptococcus suis]